MISDNDSQPTSDLCQSDACVFSFANRKIYPSTDRQTHLGLFFFTRATCASSAAATWTRVQGCPVGIPPETEFLVGVGGLPAWGGGLWKEHSREEGTEQGNGKDIRLVRVLEERT